MNPTPDELNAARFLCGALRNHAALKQHRSLLPAMGWSPDRCHHYITRRPGLVAVANLKVLPDWARITFVKSKHNGPRRAK